MNFLIDENTFVKKGQGRSAERRWSEIPVGRRSLVRNALVQNYAFFILGTI